MMSLDGLHPLIANWREVAVHFLRGVQSDAHSDGTQETLALLTRLLAFPDVASLTEVMHPGEGHPPVLPIHFRRGETSLRLFTTIATFWVRRATSPLQEVRIECFFPIDGAAEAICQAWAA